MSEINNTYNILKSVYVSGTTPSLNCITNEYSTFKAVYDENLPALRVLITDITASTLSVSSVTASNFYGGTYYGNGAGIYNAPYLPLSGGVLTGGVTGTTLDINNIQFDLTYTGATPEGQLSWNNIDKTLNLGIDQGSVLQIGQEQLVRVVNKSGADILNGAVVWISGSFGNRAKIDLADYRTETASTAVIGVVTTSPSIGNNNNGYVTTEGLVRDLNLSAYTEGDILYLHTGGTLTNIMPTAPLHSVKIGVVTNNSATEGALLVHVQNGYELGELHDISTTGATTNDILTFDGVIWRPTGSPTLDNITITGNTYLLNLSSATEHVLVQTASTSQISSIQTDQQYITNAILITDLINEVKWSGSNGTYAGTTTGAVEGQEYIGVDYSYTYQNSIFTRYPNSAFVLNNYVNVTGDTMTGNLIITSATVVLSSITNTTDIYVNTDSGSTIFLQRVNWRDEYPSQPWVAAGAAAAPDLIDYSIGGITVKKYSFDGATTEELLNSNFEVPHDYAYGNQIELHVHWRPTSTATGTTVWNFDWCYSPANDGAPIPQTSQSTSKTLTANSQYHHFITSFGNLNLTGSTFSLGHLINFNIRRDPTFSGDTYPDDIILEQVALHMPIDSFGSRQQYIK